MPSDCRPSHCDKPFARCETVSTIFTRVILPIRVTFAVLKVTTAFNLGEGLIDIAVLRMISREVCVRSFN